ncbi:ribonuclease Y [Cellulomonas palmilytica]|uniref:ribonuclease Y n=1 Tax=Cellulomonas palmilytica TaxID=2608402 RepID=UPI001F1AD236|nr:ribonuclease Y [Cellulomonas palmilytica]UJP38729.1 ribonuclease Y [Cellulomonas palmilytica]
MGESGVATVVGLLGACLVALILVLLARREAAAQREQAAKDVAEIKEEARELLASAERREQRARERDEATTAAQSQAQAAEERAREHERTAQAAERAAERALAAAERDSAARVDDAARQARETVERAQAQARAELESAAGLTQDEARAALTRRITEQAQNEASSYVRRAEAQARRTAEARARRILATAVHRTAVATSAQAGLTVVTVPSDEMKGRIIGKEGRNIRSFEALTGVNVLVDEQPDAVVLSCFDAERREVAQVTLEALVADGRIHPQRIEEAYADALAGADERAVAAGHAAAERAGVEDLHPVLVRTLGRLRLRTSYGQNVLEHLVECALLAGSVAAELGADEQRARRAALLHDVGKALTNEIPGTHAAVGAELARRHGEDDVVVNAIAAHHDEVPLETVEAVVVQIADAVSAARPGARRQELDQYLERMDRLESLVAAHRGVRRALAMAAGREVRVVVEPSEVADDALPELARAIARHIEADLTYPGEITVTVVREIRASATAD